MFISTFWRQRLTDGCQQGRPIKRLMEKAANVFCARPLLVTDLMAACNQEYRQVRPRLFYRMVKLKAVHGGDADVGDRQSIG